MKLRLFRFNKCGLILALVPWNAQAQEILEPPFGLQWGESPEKLIQWASRLILDVTITLPGNQPALRVLKIAPKNGNLPGTEASGVEGRFLEGKLYEITVHYNDPTLSSDKMVQRFTDLKKQISSEQGAMVADRGGKTISDDFVTEVNSFYREPIKGLQLILVATQISDLLRQTTLHKFSLIYRNENLRVKIEDK